jgi:SAM-dependent methyltransferase
MNERTDQKPGSAGQYRLWGNTEVVDAYRRKGRSDFFVTDQYFLSRIARDVGSILDVGCAAGRLLEAFGQFGYSAEYLGIDIVPENIDAAKANYPDRAFQVADAVNFEPGRRFDLVYCAGTLFHIPEFRQVISNMLAWSDRYVGFEVKFAPVADHLIDIDRCYSKFGTDRVYMIPLNLWSFLGWLTAQPGIGRVQMFGYRTPVNSITVTPPGIDHFVSTAVFIEKGAHLHEVSIDLPFADLAGGQ